MRPTIRPAGARVTAKDVARVAGVSQATVSYVINDNPDQKITEATRSRVLAAVEELGYTPSASARALRRGSSDLVVLLLSDVPLGPTVSAFIERLTDAIEVGGLTLVSRRLKDGAPAAALWRDLHPAAVIALAAISERDVLELGAAGVPIVQITLDVDPAGGTTVPQVEVGRMQVRHLVERGHRRLAYAALDDPRVAGFRAPRLAGVRAACQDLGLDEPDVVEVRLDGRATAPVVRAWADAGVTAVVAYNDEVAFAVLAGMRLAGLEAPADLAVIGVDDIPLAGLAQPPLTTVDQNLAATVELLAGQVLARVRDEPDPPVTGPHELLLVVREST